MRTIFRCQFGSVIYGTSLPSSDRDYKSIFVPSPKDIILQRAPKVITNNTKKDITERNTSDDIDDEANSYQEYLRLLLQGQTPALDMLFCQDEFVEITSPEWELIKSNKEYFLHKGINQFVGYTKQQAAKYGIKGSRVNAARKTVEFLKSLDQKTSLHQNLDKLEEFVETSKTLKLDEKLPLIDWEFVIDNKDNNPKRHFTCCNRKVQLNTKVHYALDIYQKTLDSYGNRARLAEKNEGVDFKALYHSVRVGREAYELLTTGHITFPRPEAELLLKIRKGELPYAEIAELIEEGLHNMIEAQEISTLPDKPNFEKAEELIISVYTNELDWYGVNDDT
jgi:predicted nucleotidyltransferase